MNITQPTDRIYTLTDEECKMNDNPITICGDDMSNHDAQMISEIIADALYEKGILTSSFAWSISIDYIEDEE